MGFASVNAVVTDAAQEVATAATAISEISKFAPGNSFKIIVAGSLRLVSEGYHNVLPFFTVGSNAATPK